MGNVCYFFHSGATDSIHVCDTQGAKAAQKRERNSAKNDPKGSKSQAKVNEAAKSIICCVCRQSFVSHTSNAAILKQHN
jgi:hypothetical protein